MKECKRCGRVQPLTNFNVKRKDRGTYGSYCKPCQREYSREHYEKNKPDYLARPRNRGTSRHAVNRERLLQYLDGKRCTDCGEPDRTVLEFDHVTGLKRFTIAAAVARKPWREIEIELEKCVVRCANCHRKKTARDFGWFRGRDA